MTVPAFSRQITKGSQTLTFSSNPNDRVVALINLGDQSSAGPWYITEFWGKGEDSQASRQAFKDCYAPAYARRISEGAYA